MKPSSVLVIGSGPIVIGQACEFDYSGVQAIKALKEEGIRVVLLNSNPATLMTDPGLADAVYIEPMVPEAVEALLAREKVEAVLPTVGGQTGLNLAVACARAGIFERHGARLIGASTEAIETAEDRELFKGAMTRAGLPTSRSFVARSVKEGLDRIGEVGYPAILRPSFTLGGVGGGIARDGDSLERLLLDGLSLSPVHAVLVEESLIGWKEFELEVIRDRADNAIVVCSIENLDPMGVHTGDSITVAPAQTLTDKEYQIMRDWGLKVLRTVGVETGGSNVQFALHPGTGRIVVVEMNPRVSRSSALASKATGYPIARVATLLALGKTLDEIPNAITGTTPASFEPAIDYVVTKVPRWAFDKFKGTDPTLTTAMKSIGEVMAIGRTFSESLSKAVRSLEVGRYGLLDGADRVPDREALLQKLQEPNWERLFYVAVAFNHGLSVAEVHELTGIDPWFLQEIESLVAAENRARFFTLETCPASVLRQFKRKGLSDRTLAGLWTCGEDAVRERRKGVGLAPSFLGVDTCAAEFDARTPYFYSAFEDHTEAAAPGGRTMVVLGSGPNRIGQGIEFDYCCCQAVMGFADEGFETVMVNCNPETVSTDFDTATRLYFEPVTLEDVTAVLDVEKPAGVVVTFGGQTPLKLARDLERLGYPLRGTPPAAIHRAEDREAFQDLCRGMGLHFPEGAIARSVAEARREADALGFPLIVRPSYVLGGQGMAVITGEDHLDAYLAAAMAVSEDNPLLLDRFLEEAVEVDADALCDGREAALCGILEHVEKAGIHSGDSSQVFPPQTLPAKIVEQIEEATRAMALELGVVGLLNVQFALRGSTLYVLEVNPRVSRTVPFLAKARGVAFPRLAARLVAGRPLSELAPRLEGPASVYVKASVFPFARLRGEDPILGPEMKSTGEVMGIGPDFGVAFAKALTAAGTAFPAEGGVFVSVRDSDKAAFLPVAAGYVGAGFRLFATSGTRALLEAQGIPCEGVNKVGEGKPDAVDLLRRGDLRMVINTPLGRKSQFDEAAIRMEAIALQVPCLTSVEAARAALAGIRALGSGRPAYRSLGEWQGRDAPPDP
jgi:carbamoyl-phosphate synthase large subunit